MMDHCHKCDVEIRPEDTVVRCEVFCKAEHVYHAKCVGLSYDEGCACLHSNICWMCDSCRHAIDYGRFRKAETATSDTRIFATQDEVVHLKTEVERINTIVMQFTSPPSTIEASAELTHHTMNVPLSTSSPLTSTRSNIVDPAVDLPSDVNINNNTLQLYVSNIANDVTENEIGLMVCEALGAERVFNVKCLVSPWKDTSTLDYVSFKVVVDAQYRDTALNASKWPTGVRCREFRDRYSSVWRPTRAT